MAIASDTSLITTAAPTTTRHPNAATITVASTIVGLLLAVAWSFHFVDSVIGDNVADTLLGESAKEMTISGAATGLIFSFVSGLAGTFTACNAAAAAAFAPMGELASCPTPRSTTSTLARLARPIGWLAVGMVAVSGTYGFVGVLLGDRLPQLSTAVSSSGMPVRLIQASIVFGVIGLAMIWLGLSSLGVVPDVFEGRPTLRVVTLGALVGAFVVGRPFPLFNKLFHWAADKGNPFLGAAIFILQSLGNIVLMTILFAAAAAVSKGRFLDWLTGDRNRSRSIAGSLLLALGIFTVAYWDIRVPSLFDVGWFPTMPYND